MIDAALNFRRKTVYRFLFGMVLILSLLLTSCGGTSPAHATETAVAAFTPTPNPSPTPAGVTPDQDLAALIASAADGDVITLAGGVFSLNQGVVIDKSLTLVGAGSEQTVITADAPAADYMTMIAFTGSGTLTLQGISLEYIGSEPSAVLYVISGALGLEDCVVTGATVSSKGAQLGAVQLTDSAIGLIRDSRIVGSVDRINPDAPEKIPGGILVSGSAQLTLENSSILGSYLGVYAFGDAVVTVSGSTITNTYAGFSLLENASGTLTSSTLEGSQGAQVALFDTSKFTAAENTFNNLEDSNGIQVNETAYAHLENNKINNGLSGIVFTDNSTGEAVANEIMTASNIGILVSKDAAPVLDSNILESCYIGISYQDNAAGSAVNNNILFGDIGISITSPASPSLVGNTVQGYTQALFVDPADWLDQLNVSDNSLTDGEPEIVIEVSTAEP